MTDQGPLPWKPPVANIPLPRVGQTIPPANPPTRGESRKAEKLSLVDGSGREANLPRAKLVLVSFYTSGSMASVRAVPALNGVREKYAGRGVEVVGIGCDDEPLDARVMAADRFRKDHGVKYTLLTEAGKRSGELLRQYGVTELPAAVLLSEQGDVLWQGNPNKPTGLAEAIEAATR
jgi:peroxiredoxin